MPTDLEIANNKVKELKKENDSLAKGQSELKAEINKLKYIQVDDSTKKISGYKPGTIKYKRQERVVKPVMKSPSQ